MFEITRTIYSNSERSEQFLVTECFFTSSWRFLISNKLEQLEIKLEKNIGIKIHAGKVRKTSFQMTATWNEMVLLRHFDINVAVCNALLLHKSRKEKIAFSSVITDFKFIYFLVNIFLFFPLTFPFPIYLWLYCTKSTAGLFSTVITALLCSLLMSHPILKVRKPQKFFCLVHRSNEKNPDFCLSL